MLSSEASPHLSALAELLAAAIRFDYNGGAIRGKDFRKWFDGDSLMRTSGHEMERWFAHMAGQLAAFDAAAKRVPGARFELVHREARVTMPSGDVVVGTFDVGGVDLSLATETGRRSIGLFGTSPLLDSAVLWFVAASASTSPTAPGLPPSMADAALPVLRTESTRAGWVLVPPSGVGGSRPVIDDRSEADTLAIVCSVSSEVLARQLHLPEPVETTAQSTARDRRRVSRVRGSLLGGAVGDALGFPVEFDSLAALTKRAGGPVRDYLPISGLSDGAISDDTQMTLFTADAISRFRDGGADSMTLRDAEAEAYLDWYDTQLGGSLGRAAAASPGSLLAERWLYSRRAPGTTIMGALESAASRPAGTPVPDAVNSSKGCGTVMRSAPFGLVAGWTPDEADRHSADAARITHGHPTAAASAGVFARIVRLVLASGDLLQSVFAGLLSLEVRTGLYSDEATADALMWALNAATTGAPSPQRIEEFGGGWIAEEALGIAVYCALVYPGEHQILDALSLAVSHSGDSDSTGAICGNLLGALHGEAALPAALVARLEGLPTITRVADALARAPQN
jgi:ADP-ribosylglycohydrolase